MNVLLLGSGPNAPEAGAWDNHPFDFIVAMNNSWRIRPDWNALVYPYDFPPDRMPNAPEAKQQLVDETAFVPANNKFGGFVYAGATMAFTTGYWVLAAQRPRIIAYLGCDMVYPKEGKTHFYGTGTADPLRADPSLRSLEAKSARFSYFAQAQGCAVVNLSSAPESRLVLPRASLADLQYAKPLVFDTHLVDQALRLENSLAYTTPNGFADHLEIDIAKLDELDQLWLSALAGSD